MQCLMVIEIPFLSGVEKCWKFSTLAISRLICKITQWTNDIKKRTLSNTSFKKARGIQSRSNPFKTRNRVNILCASHEDGEAEHRWIEIFLACIEHTAWTELTLEAGRFFYGPEDSYNFTYTPLLKVNGQQFRRRSTENEPTIPKYEGNSNLTIW